MSPRKTSPETRDERRETREQRRETGDERTETREKEVNRGIITVITSLSRVVPSDTPL